MDPATWALGSALWHAGKATFNGAVDRRIPTIVDNVVRRFASGQGMSERGQKILTAFRNSMVKYGRQRISSAFKSFRSWLLAPENREDTAEFLNEEGIEMVDMGSYEALDSMDMYEAAAAAAEAEGMSYTALMAALGEAMVIASPIGVAVVESTGGIGAWTDRSDFSNGDHADVPIHPHHHHWWNPLSWGSDSDWANPSDEPSPKRPKPNPVVGSAGDFSGLVKTFVNPVTSQIIGYKGVPRKRKFSALHRYSPFWKKQMRLTQTSVLAGPSQA